METRGHTHRGTRLNRRRELQVMASASQPGDPSPSIFISPGWSAAADSIANDFRPSSAPVALICGPKNCGKTTFSRHLVNTLLHRCRKVAYLDTDVGQPEFTPPGFLSLTVIDSLSNDLAIPCLKTPERSFFFGDISSKTDPKAYLTYIYSLHNYYRKEYCSCSKSDMIEVPLVINTPGWVKGVGYEILVDMLKHIAPSHVVKINISAESKNLPDGAFWLDDENDDETTLININSARQDSFNRSILVRKDSRRLRDLKIMAYFRQCFPGDLNITTIKELAHALTSHPPYQVPISSITIKHLHCRVPRNEIFYSLNATIVGLAISSEASQNLPWCIGLGIVRAIDVSKGFLYVITPVFPDTLEKVDLLLQGYIQLPTFLLEVQGCTSPYMSTDTISAS